MITEKAAVAGSPRTSGRMCLTLIGAAPGALAIHNQLDPVANGFEDEGAGLSGDNSLFVTTRDKMKFIFEPETAGRFCSASRYDSLWEMVSK